MMHTMDLIHPFAMMNFQGLTSVAPIAPAQEFNMTKRLESAYKQRLQRLAGKDPTMISAVDSSVYAQRFFEFITSHIQ